MSVNRLIEGLGQKGNWKIRLIFTIGPEQTNGHESMNLLEVPRIRDLVHRFYAFKVWF